MTATQATEPGQKPLNPRREAKPSSGNSGSRRPESRSLCGAAHNCTCGARQHRAIVTAMDRHDVEAACNLMEAHLSDVEAGLDLEPEPASPQSLADVLSRYSCPSRPAGRATRPRATGTNE
jgi:hypothetical protein